jgi:hypothetical protein
MGRASKDSRPSRRIYGFGDTISGEIKFLYKIERYWKQLLTNIKQLN